MNLFNKVFGISTKEQYVQQFQQTTPSEQQEDIEIIEQNTLASLGFLLLRDGSIQIIYHWDNQDKSTSEIFGRLIHHVLSGNAEPQLQEQLQHYVQANMVTKSFAKSIWKAYLLEKTILDKDPIVSPSQALKLSNLQLQQEPPTEI
jgi:hypothetical protein